MDFLSWDECPKCGKGDNTKHIHQGNPKWEKGFKEFGIDHRGAPMEGELESGICDGVFEIAYRGHCFCCGFKYEFNHEENLL